MTERLDLEFGENNANWVKDPESNEMFLQMQEHYFNHRLNTQGHVFLNEVMQSLGFPPTRQGTYGGWVLTGKPAYVDIRIGNNIKGTITVTLVYQENILDAVWPEEETE